MKKTKKGWLKKMLIIIIALIVVFAGMFTYKLGQAGMGPLKSVGLNRKPVQITQDMCGYTEQTFTVDIDGQKIVGSLYLPDNMEHYEKAVIVSPGFNSPAQMLAVKAKSFAGAGIAGLVFDFRGGAVEGKSDGDTKDMSITTEIQDLNAVIDALKTTEGFENTDIYLMGESMGGLVTAMTGAGRSDIAGLMLCFPAYHTVDSAKNAFATLDDIPETANMFGMDTGKGLWTDLWNLDLYSEIVKYTGNVIILYGTADTAVPIQYVQQANRAYENSELFMVEGAGHGFSGDDEKSTLKTMYEFMMKH